MLDARKMLSKAVWKGTSLSETVTEPLTSLAMEKFAPTVLKRSVRAERMSAFCRLRVTFLFEISCDPPEPVSCARAMFGTSITDAKKIMERNAKNFRVATSFMLSSSIIRQ